MTAFGIGSNLTFASTYSYTPYDVPDKITLTQSGQWMEFGFTGNGQRAYERDGTGATPSRITYYAGPGFFEQDNTIAGGAASVSEVREYLATPAGTVGVVITTGNTSVTKYYLQDHLGSNIAAVDETGGGISRNSYDVWGVRTTTGAPWDNGDRGYTGHEHLNFGLIHMNGRVYDPRWGRFLQTDPIVQSPYDLQSYNRYAYVMNNPLSFTDPTGFAWWNSDWNRRAIRGATAIMGLGGDFVGAYLNNRHAYNLSQNPYARMVGAAVASYFTFGALGGGIVGGAASGFAAGGIQGGNLQSAVQGAFAGAIGVGFGGTGMFGQMIGSGVNGYLQTGTSEGFARGFAAGALPNDLGFTGAYNNNAYANVGIGILRDGARGAIVADNRRGFMRGVAYGQVNNAIGHIVGATFGNYKEFKDGVFFYEKSGGGGITFGNVVTGGKSFFDDPLNVLHERDHYENQVEKAFGALYVGAHAVDLLLGNLGQLVGLRCAGFIIEEHVQKYSYSSMRQSCSK